MPLPSPRHLFLTQTPRFQLTRGERETLKRNTADSSLNTLAHEKYRQAHVHICSIPPKASHYAQVCGPPLRCPKAVGKSREAGSIVSQRVLARAGVEFVREGLSGELATEGPLLQGQDTREGQITWGTSKRHPSTSHGSGHESEGQDVP